MSTSRGRITTSVDVGTAQAHRTISGLDGTYPPLPGHVSWASNPGKRARVRFLVDLTVRGTTALADDPQVTFRRYLRNGGATGYVGMGTTLQVTRPRLQGLSSIKLQKTADNGATFTDYSANVIDSSGGTQADLDALDILANGDWFHIGGPVPFIGAALDVDAANVNANAATLTVQYWNGTTWAAVANMVDGTANAGATLGKDGQITWDKPAAGAWVASTINGITAYWLRCSVSAQLSANVDVEEVALLMPIQAIVDVEADGDDAMLFVESQDASVTGTVAYTGAVVASWR